MQEVIESARLWPIHSWVIMSVILLVSHALAVIIGMLCVANTDKPADHYEPREYGVDLELEDEEDIKQSQILSNNEWRKSQLRGHIPMDDIREKKEKIGEDFGIK